MLCADDIEQEIKIDFYRSETNGNHKLLGGSYFNVRELNEGKKNLEFKKSTVEIKKFQIVKSANFLEYVFGGCEINLSVAIDFTLSNGDPKDNDSLHCKDPRRNEYIQAIRAVGDILQYYDSDKEIPAYGFGARVPPQAAASHCLALNGDIFSPECNGIDEIIDCYKNCIDKL